ncbi:MAG TPA: hypothetical protein VIQ30_05490 [Pseudonocardia sp.]
MTVQYVRARVTGPLPIRDSVTRESVEEGGIVRLLARDPNANRLPRCPRHPVKGVRRPEQTCICGSVLIEPLVASGAIEILPDEPVKPEKKA